MTEMEFHTRGTSVTLLRLLLAFCILIGAAQGSFAQNFSHIRLSTTQYGNSWIPPNMQPQVGQWLTSHFDYIDGGWFDLSPYDSGVSWSGYLDGAGYYSPAIYGWIHDVGTQNGYKYEDLLLHMKQDYAVTPGWAWQNLDQFDYFEQNYWTGSGTGSIYYAVNGAFTLTGSSYTDVTLNLYDNQHKTTVSDKLLLGYAEPFDLVNISVSKARVGGSVTWQFWNGANWATLSPRIDTTHAITASGYVQFTPPSTWKPNSVNGSRTKYWLQAVVSRPTVAPVLSRVWGDDWHSHSGNNNSRGWSKTDSHRVNIGLGNLEYNPTPPSTATARFRYQARATGLWAPDYVFGNPSNIQNNQRTWATALAKTWSDNRQADGLQFNSIFFDNSGGMPNTTPAFVPTMSDDLPQNQTWIQDVESLYSTLYSKWKTGLGPNFGVDGNVDNDDLARQLDWSTHELSFTSWQFGDSIYNVFPSMDDFVPANNPTAAKSTFAAWDNYHFGYSCSGASHVWDTANRTPISVLAAYYTGANSNTVLTYNTLGWSYWDTDEYYYWSPNTTTLTSQLNSDSSSNSKSITLADDTRITLPGGPLWSNATVATSADQAVNVYGYAFKIGNEVIQPFKDATGQWHTFTPVLNTYPVGTQVKFAVMGHQSTDPIPDWHNVWYWANYFPAMSVNIGQPDSNGWKGGARDLNYIPSPTASGVPALCVPSWVCGEVWRRDFTNAIILDHTAHGSSIAADLDTYGPPIQLGGTFYPLNADGTTGAGITQIQLRGGEGAILMKQASPARR